MKKILLSAVVVWMTIPVLAAEETAQLPSSPTTSEFKAMPTKVYKGQNGVARVIPELGIVVSNYTGSDISGFDNKMGYSLGLAMDVGAPTSQIVAESGIFYRRFGSQFNAGGGNATIDVAYLAIPLLAKVYTNPVKGNSAYFKGGIIPGVLVFKEASVNTQGDVQNNRQFPYNELDLEVALGIGGRFHISEGNDFFLEATYNRGLTNVIDTGSTPSSPVYNAAVLLTGGVGFNM